MYDVFTVDQTSKRCRFSSTTNINWIDAGYIKAYKTPEGHRRINLKDFEIYKKTGHSHS